ALVDRRPAVAFLPVVAFEADALRECVEAPVEIDALAVREAVAAAVARLEMGNVTEFGAKARGFVARQVAATHAGVDPRVEVRLPLVDGLPGLRRSGGGHGKGASSNRNSQKLFHL